jgi:hypothetical protein
VFQLGVLAAAKAAALRILSALYFPINWSVRPSRGFALLAALSVALIVWILWTTPLDRRRGCFALVFVMIGALPAPPQMLIGADLQKSRLLALRLGSLFQTALCRSAIWAVTRIESRSPTTDWLLSKRGQVTFRWRDSLHNKKRLRRLPVEGFLCRFLLHVLPKAW